MIRICLAIACTGLWLATASAAMAQISPVKPPPLREDNPNRKTPTPEEAKEAAKQLEALRAFWGTVRKETAIPDDLKGQAVAVPVSEQTPSFMACLYVPTTFARGRTYPLLIECAGKGSAPFLLQALIPMAEKHESLLLVVENTFAQGRAVEQQTGWTREGNKDFTFVQVPMDEMLRNMAEDEKNLQALVKQISAKYGTEPKAVGVTGFLWPGLMAYRLTLAYPSQFCCCIARTAAFDETALPKDAFRARNVPFYIISGEREPAWSSEASQRAVAFFKQHQFTKVVVEKIPNSGVDPRPEITANYFRAAVEEALGQEHMAFYRVFSKAVRCIEGLPAAGDLAASEGLGKTSKATPAARPPAPAAAPKPTDDDSDSDDAPRPRTGSATPPAAPAPPPPPPSPTVEEAMAAIKAFNEQHPKSAFRPALEFINARLVFEKLGDRKKADELLRPFLRPPLRDDPAAVAAIFYLAEKVIDRTNSAQDAAAVLGAIINRRGTSPEDVKRATELRKQFLGANPTDAGVGSYDSGLVDVPDRTW